VKHEGPYLLHNSQSLFPVQGHIKTDHLLTPYFVRPVLILFPPSNPRFTSLSIFFQIFTKFIYILSYLFIYNSTVLAIILLSYLGSCLALCFYLFLQFFNAGLEQGEQSCINIQLNAFYDIMFKIQAHYSIWNLSVATSRRIVHLLHVLNSSQRATMSRNRGGKRQIQLSNKIKVPLQKEY